MGITVGIAMGFYPPKVAYMGLFHGKSPRIFMCLSMVDEKPPKKWAPKCSSFFSPGEGLYI